MSDTSRAPSVEQVILRADALDARRREQIKEQRLVIDRILRGGETLDEQFLRQQAELIKLRTQRQQVIDELVQVKNSRVARQVLAILDPTGLRG